MDCRTTSTHKFRTRSDSCQQEQWVHSKEKICKHIIRYSYRTDLYFHVYKLTIEIDENRHRHRNIDSTIKRQKATEQELGYKFIRIHPGKEEFGIFRAINEISRHIK